MTAPPDTARTPERPAASAGTRTWDALRWVLIAGWVLIALGAWELGERTVGEPFGFNVAVWGLQVPGWLSLCSMVHAVASLTVLVWGPQPWRATRWAWFWLLGTPVTLLAFLVLSGPTSPLRAPRDPARRLRGGKAFIIGVITGTAWQYIA